MVATQVAGEVSKTAGFQQRIVRILQYIHLATDIRGDYPPDTAKLDASMRLSPEGFHPS